MNTKYRVQYNKFYESNTYGTMEVIDRAPGGKLLVRFVDTGYETWALAANVLKGKVKDNLKPHHAKHLDWETWDESFANNSGQVGKIIAKLANRCIVQFKDTGYTTEAEIHNVRQGKIKDPYSKSFLGIGYLGEFEKVSYWKQAKQLWSNVMKRCYNPKDYMGYYGEAFVDPRWHCFANFLDDVSKLENFSKWLDGKENGMPYNLDKDLKFPGNKVYSREACMFVSEYENKSAGAINARKLDKINGRYS